MTNNAIRQIELLTSTDYMGALSRVAPTETELEILRVHMAAPDHTITASQLAYALGFSSWRATNLNYGKFAGRLCSELNVSPSTKLSILVEYLDESGSEWQLCLRSSVIEALRDFGIGDHRT